MEPPPLDPAAITQLLKQGIELQQQQRFQEAIGIFQEVLHNDANSHTAFTLLAGCLIPFNLLEDARNLLEHSLSLQFEAATTHDYLAQLFRRNQRILNWDFHRQLAAHYRQEPPGVPDNDDTLFLDPELALATARQGLLFHYKSARFSRQLCYFVGEPLPGAPDTLIAIPARFGKFFTTTSLRLPLRLRFDPAVPQQVIRAANLAKAFDLALTTRALLGGSLEQRCRELQPDPRDRPWRVLIPCSIYNTVLPYSALNLAQAFTRLGFRVMLDMEPESLAATDRHVVVERVDAEGITQHVLTSALPSSATEERMIANCFMTLEDYDTVVHATHHLEFNPHLVININRRNPDCLAPAVHNLIWWQDPVPEINPPHPLEWRERDHNLVFNPVLNGMLQTCGASELHPQPMCIDPEIFRPDPEVERKHKVVFVGYSQINFLSNIPAAEELAWHEIRELFEAGEAITDLRLNAIAARRGVEFGKLWWQFTHLAVRDISVRWLCQASDLIEVEVYGGLWFQDDVVAPFFKGEIGRGAAIARLYQKSACVLVPHPFDLQSQRLHEATACGAVPIVYDCRYRATPPHWDRECLWYRTRSQLRRALTQLPEGNPLEIARDQTWEAFARRVIELTGAPDPGLPG